MANPIVLFTDFGLNDPYVGQVHLLLAQQAPGVPVVDLFHAVPNYDIRAGAYLLPALVSDLPPGAVVIAVVDPGVGSAREALAIYVDGRWYLGPDNGLFEILLRRAPSAEIYAIRWKPRSLSESFHGRDLFAPVAARLVRGESVPLEATRLSAVESREWPDDWGCVLFIDHYGNAITGMRAKGIARDTLIELAGRQLTYARVFSEVEQGAAFWYENANGLIEIAINQGHAANSMGLSPGSPLRLIQQ